MIGDNIRVEHYRNDKGEYGVNICCEKCGHILDENWHYCPHCGIKLICHEK